MANGDLCIHCDLQETEHKYPEYAPEGQTPCGHFESPIKHHPDCSVIDCNGDCEETFKRLEFEALQAENRVRNSWFMDPKTGQVVRIDMST